MELIGNGVCVCVWGVGYMPLCFFPFFFLSLCFFCFHFFSMLIMNIYLLLMLNQKISWSPVCLSTGKLCPRNRLAHVFAAFNTGFFMEDIAFGRAWPLHFGESTWDTGENKTFAYIPSGADQSLYGDLAAKCIFCNLKLLLFHNIMLVFAHWGWGVGESGF